MGLFSIPPVVGGTPDSAHPSVVAVAAGAELCSGVVVAPRVVLTAGHCTLDHAPGELEVRLGTDSATPDRVIAVAEVHTFPRFGVGELSDDERAGLDLAAVVLAEDSGLTAVAYARDGDLLDAATAVVVGFGVTAPGTTTAGTRRFADVPIVSTCDRLIAFGDDDHGACLGDSGGAVLVGDTLVGLVSFATRPTCPPPEYATRVDPYAAWIDTIVAGTPDDACAVSCPDTSSTDCFAPAPDAGVDPPVDDPGCDGCASGGDAGGALLILLVLLRVRNPSYPKDLLGLPRI